MINSTVEINHNLPKFEFTDEDITNIPGFAKSSYEFIKSANNPHLNQMLDAFGDLGLTDVSKAIVTVTNQVVDSGYYTVVNGWHVDWATHLGFGIPPTKKRVYLFWIGDDVVPTEFFLGELPDWVMGLDMTRDDDDYEFDRFWLKRDAFITEQLQRDDVTLLRTEQNVLYGFDHHGFHRGSEAIGHGRRVMVKIECDCPVEAINCPSGRPPGKRAITKETFNPYKHMTKDVWERLG